ncbi:glycosyltransferase [Tessaracoccus flavus]|uniref:Glycosyl transferase family 1 n=1 Tax=Tessaracoccus flavus TaxID=1610493 RepID=A0A1Q2CBK8_9ACTN|nr:glycosyltransferase [Tessaracoccus flavus]AQP43487.1 glycosyl transferase family 1 [Tessaracoccus flavus]
MRILMLVATTVATDTRVLREARTLVGAGHEVHIIGRSVPDTFQPDPGITVSSIGTSSVFRPEGGQSLAGRKLSPPMKLARWALLPQHRRSAFGRWADGALADSRGRQFDAVHAHDFTALEAGATLADERGVPLVYDSHELWTGLPREYRPTPLQDRRERRVEQRLGSRADAVITVGDGVAGALRDQYGWDHVTVVRNTFPLNPGKPDVPDEPTGFVYAGRVAAFRELEAIAAASHLVDLPVTIVGPADDTWLGTFDPGRATVLPALPLDEASRLMQANGISLVTHSDRWANHRLAQPNKLFHAVGLGLPVVATDTGELAKVVREHDLGALYPPGDAAGLAGAMRRVVHDFQRYACNVEAAREALSWDADAARLVAVYARLFSGAAGTRGEG